MQKITIAIDGYSACGKSTTARLAAAQLGYFYIDTGAMYRAVTLFFIRNNIDISDMDQVVQALSKIVISFAHNSIRRASDTYLNHENVENKIREMQISEKVSAVSALAPVRHAMVFQQQKMGINKALLMDGRDIGTTVFPDAELKIFMSADIMLRAQRRQQELSFSGQNLPLQQIIDNLQDRDLQDMSRKESPLRRAEDAILLDTSYITIQEQVDIVVQLAISRMIGSDSLIRHLVF